MINEIYPLNLSNFGGNDVLFTIFLGIVVEDLPFHLVMSRTSIYDCVIEVATLSPG